MRSNGASLRFSRGTLGALIGIALIAIIVEGMILATTGANTCKACTTTPTGKW